MRDHTSWAHCGIRVKVKSFLKFNLHLFLNFAASRYAFLFFVSKIKCCMLSHINEVDPFIFCCVFLYEIQNCIFPCVYSTVATSSEDNLDGVANSGALVETSIRFCDGWFELWFVGVVVIGFIWKRSWKEEERKREIR